MTARPKWYQSIFVHTLLLVMGVVVALVGTIAALILLRPPPLDPPLTAYELARVLSGRPIANHGSNLRVSRSAEPPPMMPSNPADELIRRRLAAYLGRPLDQVRFARRLPRLAASWAWPWPFRERRRVVTKIYRTDVAREYRLYWSDNQFNPAILGSLQAGVRQPDGSWRLVAREQRGPTQRWQSNMLVLMGLFVLLVLPIAWLFSKRIARPISAFAATAERIGRQQQVEPVPVRGPGEIRLAASALNDMQARLQRFVQERTSMVGAIAHDLRTPLSRLAFHLASAPDAVREKAEAEIAEMEGMIAGALDFVQNETRLQPLEPVDVALLVEGVVDDFADTGGNAVMVEAAPATIKGDPVLLKRLFANLVGNALTYGSSAEVRIRTEGERVIVDVADRGPGMSTDALARAFEPFYRAEGSRNRSTGGLGLGLAIVHSAVATHGGKVELFNRRGGGLCARVYLPTD
ncbi:ATP-binding protein [Sphingosinicella sp. CPCC 101087]|uniref:ATP-binding protein n=1 Tax=Sphingosinicella sp. CPCC 101087 TaxID=2497754 RepID=UPI001FB114CA|nr:ATP-binding protein [Sphingosinicella sp. CPCC 101087]